MPHPKIVTPLILFLIGVVNSTAAGQTISSPYSFIEHSQAWALFAGKANLNPGQLGLGPQDGSVGGGRYTAAFGGTMSLDVDGTVFLSSRDVLDASSPVDDRFLGTTDFNFALFDVKLRLNLTGQRTWHGLQPFVSFGVGLALPVFTDRTLELDTDMPRDEWYEFGTRFAGTFGGGVNYYVSDRLSVRLDGIMALFKIATPLGWRTTANDPLGENPDGEWVSSTSFRLGAAWRF